MKGKAEFNQQCFENFVILLTWIRTGSGLIKFCESIRIHITALITRTEKKCFRISEWRLEEAGGGRNGGYAGGLMIFSLPEKNRVFILRFSSVFIIRMSENITKNINITSVNYNHFK